MSCKLIRKAISNRLQVHSVTSNFLYPNQLDSIRQCLMTNASIFLTHTSGIDKRSLYKHSCIQHCSILPFLELPTPSNNSKQSVVATTRSLLTSAKLSNGLSSSGDYKRTQQEALTILSTIYIHGSWSMLQQYLSSP